MCFLIIWRSCLNAIPAASNLVSHDLKIDRLKMNSDAALVMDTSELSLIVTLKIVIVVWFVLLLRLATLHPQFCSKGHCLGACACGEPRFLPNCGGVWYPNSKGALDLIQSRDPSLNEIGSSFKVLIIFC